METNLTEVYLDNSATTRCSERAKDLMVKVLMEDYGNPSSLHMKGVEAENYIKEAKKKIAKTLKVDEKEILFTSGGTESNNTALIGAALANKRAGNHIITTSIEHASVSAVTGYLEESTVFFRKNLELICSLSADIKSMHRKEQDFCSSKIRRR